MTSEIIRLKVDRDFSLMPWLLPAKVRADVRALGRFVRLAESAALSPLASREDRQFRLAALVAALDAPGDAKPPPLLPDDAAAARGLLASIHRQGISAEHARTILVTLQRAAAAAQPGNGRSAGSASWADVLDYCRGVAAPVGRHMLALCHEDAATCGPPADALCSALRILKELRDGNAGGGPWLCIPASFMRDASISPAHLAASSARGQTRAVLDRVLDGVDALLAEAERLPSLVADRRLRLYVCVVLCRARKLARRFRLRDPLQEKVGLSRWQRHGCLLLSVIGAARRG
jgi:phytoene/squalene synthetase